MRDRYAGRTWIMSQILEATDEQEGIGKTQLIYNAFLSHDPLEEYVKLLAESGLLCYDSITGTFKSTERGLKFLNIYTEMDQLMIE
jgi:predicted transcriptional regulator